MNNITLAPIQTDQPSHLMPVFGRQQISFVRGRGSYLYTEDGTEYLDALTGIAVCGLGHAHPVIAEAIAEQAATLIHTSNIYEVPWQTAAAQKLQVWKKFSSQIAVLNPMKVRLKLHVNLVICKVLRTQKLLLRIIHSMVVLWQHFQQRVIKKYKKVLAHS